MPPSNSPRQPNVTLVSYGDMLRVPASRRRSLLKARAQGADVRMAYSALEALDIARRIRSARSYSSPSASRRRRPRPHT
jgi:hydrogenase expression/formation protein HypD